MSVSNNLIDFYFPKSRFFIVKTATTAFPTALFRINKTICEAIPLSRCLVLTNVNRPRLAKQFSTATLLHDQCATQGAHPVFP